MFDNLVVFENRYNEINEKLYDPDIVSDQKLYADLMKELKNITPIVEKYKEYQKASTAEAEAKEMLDAGGLDKDFREMVEQELNDSRKQLEVIADELKILLLPKDPNDDRNVVCECGKELQYQKKNACAVYVPKTVLPAYLRLLLYG